MKRKLNWPEWMQKRNEEIARKFKSHRAGRSPGRAVPRLVRDYGITENQIRNILKKMGVWDR